MTSETRLWVRVPRLPLQRLYARDCRREELNQCEYFLQPEAYGRLSILVQWRPLIIVSITIVGTALLTQGNLMLSGAMYLLVYALVILVLYYFKIPLIADLKRASIRKQRLVSEILHNYKHIRSSGLSQFYTDKMLDSADVIEKIKKKNSTLSLFIWVLVRFTF